MGNAPLIDDHNCGGGEPKDPINKPVKIKSCRVLEATLDEKVDPKTKSKSAQQGGSYSENTSRKLSVTDESPLVVIERDAPTEQKRGSNAYYRIQLPGNGMSDQECKTVWSSEVNECHLIKDSAASNLHGNDLFEPEKENQIHVTSSGSYDDAGASVTETITDNDEDDKELQPLEILLQFIPYYGQGDPSNDAIVRSTLSGMSVEDIDSQDEYGNTLLLLACQHRCEDLARIMLNKGANPSALNSAGACCLHFACYKESQSMSIAKVLLQNGADPEVIESTYGCTPLHYCGGSGNIGLCKMLIAHGAQINSTDFYSYTCVDYAREAKMHEAVIYLQQRLDQYVMQNSYRLGSGCGNYGGNGNGAYYPSHHFPPFHSNDWNEEIDPVSGERYFTNFRTGESLWENDFNSRIAAVGLNSNGPLGHLGGVTGTGQSQSPQKDPNNTSVSQMETGRRNSIGIGAANMPPLVRKLSTLSANPFISPERGFEIEACRIRVESILTRHAPVRLKELESMMIDHQGKESELLQGLCKEYALSSEEEVAAYRSALKILQIDLTGRRKSIRLNMASATPYHSTMSARPGTALRKHPVSSVPPSPLAGSMLGGFSATATPPVPVSGSTMDQSVVMLMIGEARAAHEAQAMQMMADARTTHEALLESERKAFRCAISESEGVVVKLQSEYDGVLNRIKALEEEKEKLQEKLQRTLSHGGEAISKVEEAMDKKDEQNAALKIELSSAREELAYEKERQKGTELIIANLNAGQADILARGQAAAEDRVKQQREKDQQHTAEIREIEGAAKAMEVRARQDLNKVKADFEKIEESLKSEHESVKKSRNVMLDALNRELMILKATFAKESSAYKLQIEDLMKSNDELLKRTDTAEGMVRSMQAEVQEAQRLQVTNLQLHKDLAREQQVRRRLHNEMEDMKGKIRVYVRIRPFSKKESDMGCKEAVLKDGKLSVMVRGLGGLPDAKKIFDFDQVFGGSDGNSQADVFRDTKHLMTSVIDGYNVCIFAYGQTGAGKSFTMIGAADIGNCLQDNGDFDDLAGITPRAVSELFRLLVERTAQIDFNVEVSMFQLYRDGLEDLLVEKDKEKRKTKDEDKGPGTGTGPGAGSGSGGPLKITLAEHSPTGLVQVEGAVVLTASTPKEVMKIFSNGSERRTTASTQMNSESSRSHLICSIVVRLTNKRTGTEVIGKLTLVDLAGSERVDKSGATGEVLKEAQSINKSLSALGDVIAALTSGQQHIPYRNHPLTMLMSDSLGGNAKTLMFVNASPADYNNAESNSSLSFANRCKDVTNSVATAGPGVQAAQMQALKKELAKLKKSGAGKSPAMRAPPGTYNQD